MSAPSSFLLIRHHYAYHSRYRHRRDLQLSILLCLFFQRAYYLRYCHRRGLHLSLTLDLRHQRACHPRHRHCCGLCPPQTLSSPVPISPSGTAAPSCQKDGSFSPWSFLETNKDLLSIAYQNIQSLPGHSLLLDSRLADTARKTDYLRYCLNISNAPAILYLIETKIDKQKLMMHRSLY